MSLRASIFLALACHVCFAQQGDKQGERQLDPIPADRVPPAPVLSQAEAMKTFQVADGFVLEPIVEDALVHMPVALCFDEDSRAWLVEMTQYMVDLDGADEHKPTGKIKVLEDTTGDGQLDRVTVFLDGLVMPRAVAATGDGVLYTDAGRLMFIRRDGTQAVGEAEVVDAQYAVGGNPEHQANGLLYGRDNWIYSAKSDKRFRRVDGKWKVEKTSVRGQWGIAQDDVGRLYYNNNSTLLLGDQYRPNIFRHHPRYQPKHRTTQQAASNRLYPARVTPGVNRAYQKGVLNADGKLVNATSASSLVIYRGGNFPESYYGAAFIPEPAAHLVKLIDLRRSVDNKLRGKFRWYDSEFLASTDEWFRPVNIYSAPDGTLWVLDLYFGLLQHKAYMTSYLRKQYESRGLDRPMENNGRIYRIRYEDNPLDAPVRLSDQSISGLVQSLNHRNGTVRDIAQRVLVERLQDPQQLEEFRKYASQCLQQKYAKHHVLWVLESTGEIPATLIAQALGSDDLDSQAAALELAHLADRSMARELLAYQAKPQTALVTVLALGKLGSKEGYVRAQAIHKQHGRKVKFIPEAYVSGLGQQIVDAASWGSANDPGFQAQLAASLKSMGQGPTVAKTPGVSKSHKASYDRGAIVYTQKGACAGCHGMTGEGQPNMGPPLAPSDWINSKPELTAKVLLHGLEGPISVNGERYKLPLAMPKFAHLSDQEIADVMTYMRHLQGNSGGAVFAKEIKAIRSATKGRVDNYTQKELIP